MPQSRRSWHRTASSVVHPGFAAPGDSGPTPAERSRRRSPRAVLGWALVRWVVGPEEHLPWGEGATNPSFGPTAAASPRHARIALAANWPLAPQRGHSDPRSVPARRRGRWAGAKKPEGPWKTGHLGLRRAPRRWDFAPTTFRTSSSIAGGWRFLPRSEGISSWSWTSEISSRCGRPPALPTSSPQTRTSPSLHGVRSRRVGRLGEFQPSSVEKCGRETQPGPRNRPLR